MSRAAGLAVAALLTGGAALAPYQVEGDGIPAPLDGQHGDPVRGRAIVLAREVSTCLLCHPGPFPGPGGRGTIGPPLEGVGDRLTPAQLRLRLVNPASTNPETVMPSFYTVTGLTRVGPAWQGKPVLSAGQIEDVVAFLSTLRAP